MTGKYDELYYYTCFVHVLCAYTRKSKGVKAKVAKRFNFLIESN